MHFYSTELFNWPLQANVWGTASDWAMVFVTSITAIYLIKTFKSQLKVQKLQYKTTVIENERYRLINMPSFKIEPTSSPIRLNNGFYECNLTLDYTLVNSHVKKCEAKITSKNSKLIGNEKNIYSADDVEKNSTNRQSFGVKAQEDHFNWEDGISIDIKIFFTDPVDNNYCQNASLRLREGITNISIDETPSLISI